MGAASGGSSPGAGWLLRGSRSRRRARHPGQRHRRPGASARRLGLGVLALLCALLAASCGQRPGSGEPDEPPPQGEHQPPAAIVPLAYQGHWIYRYGDSPRAPSGAFLWAQPLAAGDPMPEGWGRTGAFRRYPGRQSSNFLWLRTRLHGPPLHDGTLFMSGVDSVFEAYLDGQLIYRYGDMTGPPPYRFIGFRTHFIPVGTDYDGKTLALRIYSDLRNIGPFGEPRLGERAQITTDLFIEDQSRVVIAGFLSMVGILVLGLYVLRREERAHLMYGGFAISIGFYILTQLQVRSLILPWPLFWVHLELASLYLGFYFLCGFIEQIFGRGPLGLVRVLRLFHLTYVMGAALVVVTRLVPLWHTLPPFQLVLAFDALYLTLVILNAAARGNLEARIFAIGFVIAAGVSLYDLLAAFRIIPRTRLTMSHYGTGAFTLSLAAILARRFVLVHRRLRDYTSVLQLSLASVSVLDPEERTQVALDDLVRLLGARRAILFLTRPPGNELVFSAGRDYLLRKVPSADGVDMQMVEQAAARKKPVSQQLATVSTSFLQRDASTLMAAPLLARDQLLGVIYLECRTGRRGFRDDDRDILLGLANQVAIAIVASRAMRLELESALTRQRFEEQRSLLDAAVRMASGDLGSPIKVPEGSGYQHLAAALESMRRDLWTKLAMLETRTSEIQSLNEELRRQIEQRSRRLMSTIMQRQGGKAPALEPLEPGKILVGRYRVHRQIGRGAMGAVYEVERTSDGKRLAAKLLSTRADKASLLRFTREAQIMSRLSHKNLIGIADIDMTAGGVLFIVLELVSGGSLLTLRHRYGDTRWALCVLRQISDALAAIHQAGIVHRERCARAAVGAGAGLGRGREKPRNGAG